MSENTFHVALQVSNIETAVETYKRILGLEPAKVRHDYAKFEIPDPRVILSLNLAKSPEAGGAGRVGHLGIRFPGTGELVTERARVTRDGLGVIDQPNARCCYVRADKFWIQDDDGMLWEMYTSHEDIDDESAEDHDVAPAERA